VAQYRAAFDDCMEVALDKRGLLVGRMLTLLGSSVCINISYDDHDDERQRFQRTSGPVTVSREQRAHCQGRADLQC